MIVNALEVATADCYGVRSLTKGYSTLQVRNNLDNKY